MDETHFIISLTTLPSRFNNLKTCLASLLNQKYDNFEVHLNIPKFNIFEGEYIHNIDIKNNKLKIFYIDDIGSISKIYYTLLRTNKDQMIISVDDDYTYHPNMLKVYNNIVSKFENCCIGFAGIYPLQNNILYSNDTLPFIGPADNPTFVGILEGYKSICYKRDFFEPDFFKLISEKKMNWCENYIYYEDDVVISSYLGYKNIKKIVVPSFGINGNYEGPRMLSFPLNNILNNTNSGCYKYRKLFDTQYNNITKFYNDDLGIYIKK